MIPEIQNIIFDYINPARFIYEDVILEIKKLSGNYCYTCALPFKKVKQQILCTFECKCCLTFCGNCFWSHYKKSKHNGYIKQYYINNEFNYFENYL